MKKIIFILMIGQSFWGYSQCCIPTNSGTLTCQGGGSTTNAILHINNNSSCSVDYSHLTQIIIDASPWIISGTGGSSTKTINGPFTSTTLPGVTIKATGCQPDVSGFITYVFNTDCYSIDDVFFIDNPNMRIIKKDDVKEEIGISIFPNPVSSVIKFDGTDLSKYKISIINVEGREIIRDAAIENEINIERAPQGIYYYKISDENGVVKKGTLIKN